MSTLPGLIPGFSYPDVYTWVAFYQDGTSLREFDETGQDHGFGEVDLDRLGAFALLPTVPGLSAAQVLIDPASGQRPIFFRRRIGRAEPHPDRARPNHLTLHFLGWQKTVGGQNVRAATAYWPDGSMLLVDDPDGVYPDF